MVLCLSGVFKALPRQPLTAIFQRAQVLACPPESCLVPMVGGWPACPPGHEFIAKGIEGCGIDTSAAVGTSFLLRFAIISPSTGQVAIAKRVITIKEPCDAGFNYCLGQCVEVDCDMFSKLAALAGGIPVPTNPTLKFKFKEEYARTGISVGGDPRAGVGPEALDFTRVPSGFDAMLAEVEVVPPIGNQRIITGDVATARRRLAGRGSGQEGASAKRRVAATEGDKEGAGKHVKTGMDIQAGKAQTRVGTRRVP